MALVILNRSKQTFGRVLNRLTKTRRVEEPSFPSCFLELYRGSESSQKKKSRDQDRERKRSTLDSVERISHKRNLHRVKKTSSNFRNCHNFSEYIHVFLESRNGFNIAITLRMEVIARYHIIRKKYHKFAKFCH